MVSKPRRILRRELGAACELVAAFGYAVTQPALDLLGRNPGVFLERGSDHRDAALIALITALLPATCVYGVEVMIGFASARARRAFHVAVIAALIGLTAMIAVKAGVELAPLLFVGIAVAFAIVGGVVVTRFATARLFLRYSAVGPPLMVAVFLFASAASTVFTDPDTGPPATAIERPSRVVMLVYDELPLVSLLDAEGQIDAELFPNFARLAATSTWYRNHSTVSPYTEVAVPAILSGRYPRDTRAIPTLGEYPDNLFTVVRDHYELNVSEVTTRLCPGGCSSNNRPGFAAALDTTMKLWWDRVRPDRLAISFGETAATRDVRRTTRRFIRSLQATATTPRLDFAHIMLPHEPFRFTANFQDTQAPAGMPGVAYLRWTDGPGAEVARRRHLLQLQTADITLGHVLDRLVALDEFNDTMIVVTADHGMSFTSGEPLRSVSDRNFAEIMWTPFFVKRPQQNRAVVDDRISESIDVLPTMFEAMGVRASIDFDGVAHGLPRPERSDVRRLYQSGRTAFEPADVLRPEPGLDYLQFDGGDGFAEVLAAAPLVPEGGDPALRTYRIGPFGSLIGQPAAPLLADRTSDHAASIRNWKSRWASVDPGARTLPWVYNEVFLNGSPKSETVALIDNGVVVAVGQTAVLDASGHAFVMLLVPPALMVPGEHRPVVAIVRGTPERPELDPVVTG